VKWMHGKFKKLLTHKATVRKLSRNMQGDWVVEETYTDIPCFFEWGRKVVRDQDGEEVTTAGIVFFMPDAEISDGSDDVYWEIEQTSPYSRAKTTMIRIDPIDNPKTGKTHHKEVAVK